MLVLIDFHTNGGRNFYVGVARIVAVSAAGIDITVVHLKRGTTAACLDENEAVLSAFVRS